VLFLAVSTESAAALAVTPAELEAVQALIDADQWTVRAAGLVSDIQTCVIPSSQDDSAGSNLNPTGSRTVASLVGYLKSFASVPSEDALKSKRITIPPDFGLLNGIPSPLLEFLCASHHCYCCVVSETFNALFEAALDAAVVTQTDIERVLASAKSLALDQPLNAALTSTHKHGQTVSGGTVIVSGSPLALMV
jgi:hypothetical protein